MAAVGVAGVVAIEALFGLNTWTGWGLALFVAAPSVHLLTTALDPETSGRPATRLGWLLRYVAVVVALLSLVTYLGVALALVGIPVLAAVLLGLLAVVYAIGAVGGAAQVYAGFDLGMVIDAPGVSQAAGYAVTAAVMAATFGVFAARVWERSDAWVSWFADLYLATMARLSR